MKELLDMKELLIEQIKKINRKGDAITPQELESAYKAVDIIKDIETIMAMKRSEGYDVSRTGYMSHDDGMSNRYLYPYMTGAFEYGRYPRESYDNMEESYARGRSPVTGRYVSRDSYDRGYSSEEEREQLKRSLDDMKRKIDHM